MIMCEAIEIPTPQIDVFLIYSPDDRTWYFERRIPGKWAQSTSYDTREQAGEAFRGGWVVWHLDGK